MKLFGILWNRIIENGRIPYGFLKITLKSWNLPQNYPKKTPKSTPKNTKYVDVTTCIIGYHFCKICRFFVFFACKNHRSLIVQLWKVEKSSWTLYSVPVFGRSAKMSPFHRFSGFFTFFQKRHFWNPGGRISKIRKRVDFSKIGRFWGMACISVRWKNGVQKMTLFQNRP